MGTARRPLPAHCRARKDVAVQTDTETRVLAVAPPPGADLVAAKCRRPLRHRQVPRVRTQPCRRSVGAPPGSVEACRRTYVVHGPRLDRRRSGRRLGFHMSTVDCAASGRVRVCLPGGDGVRVVCTMSSTPDRNSLPHLTGARGRDTLTRNSSNVPAEIKTSPARASEVSGRGHRNEDQSAGLSPSGASNWAQSVASTDAEATTLAA